MRMIRMIQPLFSLCCTLVILVASTNGAKSAPVFTVTPASISNTYAGIVTVSATGLFTNETVVVRKYIDLNTNGVVDGTDFFLQQFTVTDQASGILIGAATNVNVPYDTNTTKGTITVPLSQVGEGVAGSVVGKYFYVFSSPSNHFTAVTNAFTITNANLAQTISGTVVSNSTAVPYAFVLVGYASGNDFNPFTGAVANSAGVYSVKVPPGPFKAVAFKTNYIGVPTATFTVAASGSVVTNLSMIGSTNFVSGRVTDTTNSSLPLVGVLTTSQCDSVGIAVCTTDTNGNYLVPVTLSNQWKIGGDSRSWNFVGYVQSNNSAKIVISSNVPGFNLSYPRAQAMVYGRIVDGNNNPLVGVRLYGQNNSDSSGLYQGDATTDVNGYYSMGLMPGNWDPEVDLGATPPSFNQYIFSVPAYSYNNGSGLTLNVGSAIRQDFIGLLGTNTISGLLRDNNLVGISNVQVQAQTTINGTNYQSRATTDSSGFYTIYVGNATWDVFVNCCNGGCDNGLPPIYQCPGDQQTTVANNNKTVNFTVQRATVLAGKLVDNLGNPVGNMNVFAFGDSGGSYGASTDGSGNYAIGLNSGGYTVGPDTGSSGVASVGLVGPAIHVNIGSSDVTNFNLICQHVTGTIKASITNSTSATGVGSINVDASCTINGTNYDSGNQQTDGTGKVGLQVCNGTWAVTANCGDLSGQALMCPTNNGATVNVAANNPPINYVVQACTLQITPTNLPSGTVGVYYDNTLNGFGCNAPFSFFFMNGSIPPGLNLAGDGELYGTPTAAGSYSFNVQMQDQQFNATTTNVSITINAAATPLQVTTFTLPNALNGGPYNASVNATGGTPPYRWQIELGSLNPPANIVLGTNGVLSGICTASANTYSFIVQVYDTLNNNADQTLSITVTNAPPPPLQITTLSLPNGNLGAHYSNNIVATGGQPPYTWSLKLGSASPPDGTTLNSVGTVAGTPTTPGAYAFRAQVNDNNGGVTNRLFQITINPLPQLLSPQRLNPSQFQLHLNGSIGQNYTLQYSTTLTNWTSFFVTNPVSTDAIILDPNATNLQRGYRALVGP
jgi:hypothetical protein